MQNLKYYVLWKKDSPLLKEYFEKYYNLLKEKLEIIKYNNILFNEIENLLNNKKNKDFILNADISSLINSVLNNFDIENSIKKLEKEINIFLSEGIESINLSQNKWKKIAWTNIRLTNIDNK